MKYIDVLDNNCIQKHYDGIKEDFLKRLKDDKADYKKCKTRDDILACKSVKKALSNHINDMTQSFNAPDTISENDYLKALALYKKLVNYCLKHFEVIITSDIKGLMFEWDEFKKRFNRYLGYKLVGGKKKRKFATFMDKIRYYFIIRSIVK